jgi:ATP-dependent exoDNAse (exonuclease V) alpha subunit
VANRELGRLESIDKEGKVTVKLDGGRTVKVKLGEYPHLDHGYAVTSRSSQSLTADRVLLQVSAEVAENPALVNSRMAYVALSRAPARSRNLHPGAVRLASKHGRRVSKSCAVEGY